MPGDLAACQLDSYARTFTTTVIQCTPTKPTQPPTTSTDTAKKRSRDSTKPPPPGAAGEAEAALYEVELADTILYPEGGGQPSDHGTIDATPVTTVQRDRAGRVTHLCPAPFQAGQPVRVAVDWARRYDHMQQHSAQHLISAQLLALADATTIGWWLSSAPAECYIDVRVGGAAELSAERIAAVEARCNELVRAALPVRVHTFPSLAAAMDDAAFVARLPAHKQHQLLDAGEGGELRGTVRVIEVEGVDVNPCGGTHVRCTSELQAVHLARRTEKVKGGGLRVFFLAGERALRALREGVVVGRALAAALSCTGEAVVEAVVKVQADARAASKANTKLLAELADLTAQRLVAAHATASPPPPLLVYHRDDASPVFLAGVADAVGEALPRATLLLTGGEGSGEGVWLLCGERAGELGGEVGKMLEGRGGGKGKRAQGKASRIDKRGEVAKWLEQQLAAKQ